MSSMHKESMTGTIRQSITAATIDLDAFLERILTDRHKSPDTLVFFKLDVESAEFELLPHLLRRPHGPACWIDYWLIEWHLWKSIRTPQREEVRRTIEERIEQQCPRRGRGRPPRIVDHDERMSIHPPAPPVMPPNIPTG